MSIDTGPPPAGGAARQEWPADLAVCRTLPEVKALRAALQVVANDGPSCALLKRIDDLESKPPAADWDGAWQMDRK